LDHQQRSNQSKNQKAKNKAKGSIGRK